MCLIIRKDNKKNFLPKVAEKDIECYKILKRNRDNYFYYTPYEDCEVDVADVFKANTNKKYNSEYKNIYWNMSFPENALEGNIYKHKTDSEEYCLGPGMVHVFASIKDAKDEKDKVQVFFNPPITKCKNIEYIIWKCVIPKGTRYYTGYFCDAVPAYGAEEIKFVERLKYI